MLFIADAVGTPGRKALEERLAALREELGVDFCIVNGENLADGVGITPKLAERILAAMLCGVQTCQRDGHANGGAT